MASLHRWFPFLSWPRPDAALLRGEVLAGLTVGLMIIPQGVAYAALAGMPLITGIYASLLPALVAVLFSASTRLSVGPTALTCLLVGSSLSGLAQPGSTHWVELAVWLSLLTGALQVVLGFARFGWLLNVISSPVLMGFTQAAALLIIGSQLPTLLGVRPGWHLGLSLPTIHGASLAFGLASMVLLVLARRWRPAYPSVLFIVAGTAAVSAWLGFESSGGPVVGPLPAGLPSPFIPGLPDGPTLSHLLLPTFVITLVSFLETASSAKVESQGDGQIWNQNQDLIGQGLAKIASGLSGAFPTSSSFSRSALNIYAGARTGWATVASVLVVVIALVLFTPALRHVPQPVLAAIVLVAVVGLLRPMAFVRLWRVSRVEAVTAGVTFGVTLAAAPRLYWGVLVGVLMALSHFLHHRLHPRIIEVGLHPDGSLRDRHLWTLPPLAPRLVALRMDADLDFAAANDFERAIVEQLAAHPDVTDVCLFTQPINRIDATGVETFGQIRRLLFSRDVTLHLVGVKLPVESALRGAGELTEGPLLKLYRTDADALAALARLQEDPDDNTAATI